MSSTERTMSTRSSAKEKRNEKSDSVPDEEKENRVRSGLRSSLSGVSDHEASACSSSSSTNSLLSGQPRRSQRQPVPISALPFTSSTHTPEPKKSKVPVSACGVGVASGSSTSSSSDDPTFPLNVKDTIRDLKNNPLYRKLCSKIDAYCKNRSHEKAEGSVKWSDDGIVDQVFDTIKKESVEIWDAREREAKTDDFEVDFIVGTTRRMLGTKAQSDTDVLTKFTGFPAPSWDVLSLFNNPISIDRFDDYNSQLDVMEVYIRAQLGDAAFDVNYPNRYLEYEDGRGNGRFIENKRSLYATRIRALEHRWNSSCDAHGVARVLIVDWTSLPALDRPLRKIQVAQSSVISAEAQSLMNEQPPNDLKNLKCGPDCKTCCRFDGALETKKYKECCRSASSIHLDKDGHPAFSGKTLAPGKEALMRIECCSLCGCDIKKCTNRALQKGRSLPLLIFRDKNKLKGWTLRALSTIHQFQFVCEYTGEIRVGPKSGGGGEVYDVTLEYELALSNGDTAVLYINAYETGNESRFVSHSCSPNLYLEPVLVERAGVWLTHFSMRANRRIFPGEELSFDYFRGLELSPAIDISKMFTHCECGSPACRYTAAKVAEYKRKEREREKRGGGEREEGDESSEGRLQKEKGEEKTKKRGASLSVQIEREDELEQGKQSGVKRRRGECDESAGSKQSLRPSSSRASAAAAAAAASSSGSQHESDGGRAAMENEKDGKREKRESGRSTRSSRGKEDGKE